jgi:hypothetical protein
MMKRLLVFSTALTALSCYTALASTFTVINTNASGAGSLLQAILDANAHPGADTIVFNIPGAGVHTIHPGFGIPVQDSVVIDGYTQPGASVNTHTNDDNAKLLIELSGPSLDIFANNCTVRGLVLNGFGGGILVSSSGNKVTGNFIGTDPTGMTAVPCQIGVSVAGSSNPANNTIGGLTPADRNVISGNNNYGVALGQGAPSNTVMGNFIGIKADGKGALPNVQVGILDQIPGSTIGGTAAGAGNVISGNHLGIQVNVSGVTIQGNKIGTAADGVAPLGNGLGIEIPPTVFNTLIGGTVPGAGNIIAFNKSTNPAAVVDSGIGIIVVGGSGHSILGNSIFANTNTVPRGTGSGPAPALGIDLFNGTIGVTPNDAGDTDTGANNFQNFPVLTSVTAGPANTVITGTLNSAASTTYRIEFFANTAVDPTGYGEGEIFIGFTNVTTDLSGNASFNVNLAKDTRGKLVTATATAPDGSTSEFSAAVPIGQFLNLSTRLRVLTGNNVAITGFTITGSSNMNVLMRALGPTLGRPPFNVPGVLADPTLALQKGLTTLAPNDNWKNTQQNVIAATGKAPPDDLESAILMNLPPGAYTGVVAGKNGGLGVALVDIYDLDGGMSGSQLTNLSTRGFVDIGANVMVAGVVEANGVIRMLLRALGPTLSQFGVTNVLADPMLEIHDAQGALIASNDNWHDTQAADIQATGKAPPNALESAILIVIPPGNTTAIVRGKNNGIGNALVDAYKLP